MVKWSVYEEDIETVNSYAVNNFFKKNKQTDKEKQMSFVEDFSHLDS